MLTNTPTGTMTVPGLITKGQKAGGAPTPGNTPLLQDRIFLPLISLWNYPAHKNEPPSHHHLTFGIWLHCLRNVYLSQCHPHFPNRGPQPMVLAFRDGPHSVYGVCPSLNKPASLYYGLLLNSFLHEVKDRHLVGPSRRLTRERGTWPSSYTPFFHTIAAGLFTRAKKVEATQVSINRWVNKQNMAHTSKTVFIQHEKERKFWHMRQYRWTFRHYAA